MKPQLALLVIFFKALAESDGATAVDAQNPRVKPYLDLSEVE